MTRQPGTRLRATSRSSADPASTSAAPAAMAAPAVRRRVAVGATSRSGSEGSGSTMGWRPVSDGRPCPRWATRYPFSVRGDARRAAHGGISPSPHNRRATPRRGQGRAGRRWSLKNAHISSLALKPVAGVAAPRRLGRHRRTAAVVRGPVGRLGQRRPRAHDDGDGGFVHWMDWKLDGATGMPARRAQTHIMRAGMRATKRRAPCRGAVGRIRPILPTTRSSS